MTRSRRETTPSAARIGEARTSSASGRGGGRSSQRPEGYIPAAGHDWLLPLYDPILRLLFREESVRRQLLDQAQIAPGDRVLDVGCGTGTQAILVKKTHPDTHVAGLDGDPKALAIGQRKAAKAGVEIAFSEGLSYALPYPDSSCERVFSSLLFHHLTGEHKRRTLAEILRVLVPGGTFYLLDFGKPVTRWERALAPLIFGSAECRDNVEGRLPLLIREAGFSRVEDLGRRGTLVGSVWYYRGSK
jgi:ubiquinone/menaquinone biosynthesis C-methylase UbiE